MDINKKMKIYNFLDKHPKLKLGLVKPYRKIMKKYTTNEETDYNNWIIKNEPNSLELAKQRAHKFKINPKISIVVPLYNTKEYFMKEIIDALKKQTYSNWELCLADGSPKPIEYINKYLKDSRIKYSIIGENKGISGNTNEAIKLATGDYIGLLDHDDLLPVFSLFEVVKAINENPDVEFLYSDEDRIEGEFHKRYGVFFKPDFSKYTLRSANYICHFSVFKKELMDKLEGERPEYDGSQDFDIVVRASEMTDKICHIPKVLYHWRVHQESTAGNADSKPYAYEVAKNVIKDHLKRSQIAVDVRDGLTPGSYELKYLVNGNPKVSLIIDAREIDDANNFVKNIRKSYNYKNVEIIVISSKYKELGIKTIEPQENILNQYNEIIKSLDTDYFVIIDDKFVEVPNQDWIQDLVGIAQNDDVGIVGTKLYNKEKQVEHCGIILGMNGAGDLLYKGAPKDIGTYMQRLKIIHNVTAVYYRYAMIDTKAFKECGLINDNYTGLLTSIDIGLKMLKNNKQVVINPLVEFEVKELREGYKNQEQETKFKEEWKTELEAGDKFYSPNLSKTNTGLSINV